MSAGTRLFLSLRFQDAPAMAAFLRDGLGFTDAVMHTDPDDPSVVHHAQMNWPGARADASGTARDGAGGGVMFGSTSDPAEVGTAKAYLVVDSDADVDRVHAQALAHGATTLREPEDMDYGGRGSTVRDPEGNQWSLGSYRGE